MKKISLLISVRKVDVDLLLRLLDEEYVPKEKVLAVLKEEYETAKPYRPCLDRIALELNFELEDLQ